jgi:Tol biopolymer transport system component
MRARSNSSRRPHRTHQPAWVAPGFCLLTLTLPLCASGWAQTTTRLSSSTSEVQGNQTSGGAYIPPFDDPDPYGTCVSGDARYVAFASLASNLVPGDTNSRWDVFVRDRQTRSTIRASVGAGGIQANGDSEFPSISADGRYVTFVSTASNLVPGDTNVRADIFVRDLQAGTTDRVSVSSTGAQANDGSFLPTISATGRYVVFQSGASNLVPGDTNLVGDAFVRDLQSGTTTRVSVDSNGVQGNDSSGDFMGAISADGRFVAFSSFASNLVPGDTNAAEDTFVHDMQTGATTRVSVDSAGGQGDSYSFYAVTMSADGRYVAFTSFADNLVGGDTNATSDVFVHDRQTGTTTLVSWDSSGNPSDNESRYPAISADGRYLAFTSKADDLVLGDTNGLYDVFVQNLQTGARTLVSVDSAATQANWNSYCEPGAISSDGRFTIFDSSAANLVSGDTNGVYDVFLHDLQTGVTTRESLGSFSVPGNSASFGPSISDNGRYAAFASAATNLVPSDINSAADVFVRDLATDNVTLVSVASNGAQGNSNSSAPQVSSNGRFVAFFSQASNLVPGDSNGFGDIFVRDIQAGSTELVTLDSSGAQGHYPMTDSPSISSDCRYVLFTALWPFVTGDTNDAYDVFVRDRLNGTTVRASVASAGAQGDGNSWGGSLSSDGRYAAFESDATNLVPNDTNGVADIFIHDMQTGATTRATLGWAGPQSNGHSYAPSLSPDGRYVAFESLASNLVPGDTNGVSDVFVCDLVTGVITRESVDSNGVQGNGPSYQAVPRTSSPATGTAFPTSSCATV